MESVVLFIQNISYEDGILKIWCPDPFPKSPYFVTPNQSLSLKAPYNWNKYILFSIV